MKVYLDRKLQLSFLLIKPGQSVVIKPNMIKESKENDPTEWKSVITSPALIRAVAERVCEQLGSTGKLSICDAPQTDSSFLSIAKLLKLNELAVEMHRRYGTNVEIIDLRNEEWTKKGGVIVKREKLQGDPNGTVVFNLGNKSLFYKHSGEGRYYGADYDYESLNKHHQGETHEYLICATPVLADVFICLPKLKTHKKTGVSLSIKNLVGINADKNWLPHYTFGSPAHGGDEYPEESLKRKIETWSSKNVKKLALNVPIVGPAVARFLRNRGIDIFGPESNTIRSGNWHGNDTTWRMALDLNRCLLYGRPNGTLRDNERKTYYTIIDGEVGMEGAGPMQGDPKHCGIYISGTDPLAVDAVAATMMGFDWKKIPIIREGFKLGCLPISDISPDEIKVVSETPEWNATLKELQEQKHFDFKPHFGWKGHIESSNYEG